MRGYCQIFAAQPNGDDADDRWSEKELKSDLGRENGDNNSVTQTKEAHAE